MPLQLEGMTVSAHDGVTDDIRPIIDPSTVQGLLERVGRTGGPAAERHALDTGRAARPAEPQVTSV